MRSEHYCERCGEDGDVFTRCDECGVEMCGDCMTGREEIEETCAQCRVFLDEMGVVAAPRNVPPIESVLPCMRQWYTKNM